MHIQVKLPNLRIWYPKYSKIWNLLDTNVTLKKKNAHWSILDMDFQIWDAQLVSIIQIFPNPKKSEIQNTSSAISDKGYSVCII